MKTIYMFEQGDENSGGNFAVAHDGDIKGDQTIGSLVYYSLFCGSSPLDVIRTPLHSDAFETSTNAKTSIDNLTAMQRNAKQALKWIVDDGFASEISVSVEAVTPEKVRVTINATVSGVDQEFNFEV